MKPEARYSKKVRAAFESHGCDVVQIVEAGNPGASDLLVEWPGYRVWLELKVDSGLRDDQRVFLKNRWRKYRNAFLLKLDDGVNRLWTGNPVAILVPGREVWSNSTLAASQIVQTIEDIYHG